MVVLIWKTERRILRSRVARACLAQVHTWAAIQRARRIAKACIAAEMATQLWEFGPRELDAAIVADAMAIHAQAIRESPQ